MYKLILKTGLYCLVLATLLLPGSYTVAAQSEPDAQGLLVRITQVDTSKFPKVVVYISVTDAAGEPVAVSPSRLVLRENGEKMKPDEISGVGEIGPLTTMLAMDISGSMNSSGKLEAAKEAASTYVDQARPGDQIGLITFNTKVDYVQPATKSHQKMFAAIDELKAIDDTAMYDAIARSIEYLEAISGRKAIIVLTDGMDNRSKISPQEVLQTIGPAGLSISTVGLGDPSKGTAMLSGLDEGALKAFAESAGGAYGYANDAESLKNLYELYGRAIQSEYVIAYTSPSTLRDGVNRALSVSVESPGGVSSSAKTTPVAFNPGGLIPEVVNPASWSTFGLLLAGLLLLLAIPAIIVFGLGFVRARSKSKKSASSKKSRIKLKS